MKENSQRNKGMYRVWQKSLQKYSVTGEPKDKRSYRSIGAEFGVSGQAARTIIMRLAHRESTQKA